MSSHTRAPASSGTKTSAPHQPVVRKPLATVSRNNAPPPPMVSRTVGCGKNDDNRPNKKRALEPASSGSSKPLVNSFSTCNATNNVNNTSSVVPTPEPTQEELLADLPEVQQALELKARVALLREQAALKRQSNRSLEAQMVHMEGMFQQRKEVIQLEHQGKEEELHRKIQEAHHMLQQQDVETAKSAATLHSSQQRLTDAQEKLVHAQQNLQQAKGDQETVKKNIQLSAAKTKEHTAESELARSRIKLVDAKKLEQEANKQEMAEALETQEAMLKEVQDCYDDKIAVVRSLEKKISNLLRHRKGATSS